MYDRIGEGSGRYRRTAGRPLTLSEKILAGHFAEAPEGVPRGGSDYVFLRPDRVALQDVTGQMVMLQFMSAGVRQASLPTTIHCDHLIRAKVEGRDGHADVYRREQRGLSVFRIGSGQVRLRLLEAGSRNNTPGGA